MDLHITSQVATVNILTSHEEMAMIRPTWPQPPKDPAMRAEAMEIVSQAAIDIGFERLQAHGIRELCIK